MKFKRIFQKVSEESNSHFYSVGDDFWKRWDLGFGDKRVPDNQYLWRRITIAMEPGLPIPNSSSEPVNTGKVCTSRERIQNSTLPGTSRAWGSPRLSVITSQTDKEKVRLAFESKANESTHLSTVFTTP